ncbi:MAG: alpha/beta fold hydrolase [Anaerolineae bacterium]|nr:alpha/beta fold hydrolase [Anaerolineae bacterium]
MSLTYTRSGNPNSPAIIFLHGMAMGQWMWLDQTQHFADYDCYNVDLPGHGGSSQIAWGSFGQTADRIAQFIESAVIGKPVYLVGMSLGAIIGLHILVRYPRLIKRAVLTGAIAERPPRWMIKLQGGLLSVMLPTGFGKRLFARTLQIPADAMPAYTESINALSMPAFKQIVAEVTDYTPPANYSLIQTPMLFATGDKDVVVNLNAVKLLARQVPASCGVYAPGLHHGWNGEAPALFNTMTRAWIQESSLPQSLISAESAPT